MQEIQEYGATDNASGLSISSGKGSLTSADMDNHQTLSANQNNNDVLEAIMEVGSDSDDPNSSSALRRYLASDSARDDVERAGEQTPLLGRAGHGGYGGSGKGIMGQIHEVKANMSKLTGRDIVQACVMEPVRLIPATILGLLLNVLDGVSYGMIMFPAGDIFMDFGSLGVSMFFMS